MQYGLPFCIYLLALGNLTTLSLPETTWHLMTIYGRPAQLFMWRGQLRQNFLVHAGNV